MQRRRLSLVLTAPAFVSASSPAVASSACSRSHGFVRANSRRAETAPSPQLRRLLGGSRAFPLAPSSSPSLAKGFCTSGGRSSCAVPNRAAFHAPPLVHQRRAHAATASKPKGLAIEELESWASEARVCGHAYTTPATEPYALSPLTKSGGGAQVPEGWRSSLVTAAGLKNPEDEDKVNPNQDAVSYTFLANDWLLYVVCDGHGEHGHTISERVARVLPLLLSRHLEQREGDHSPEDLIRLAFLGAQADLEQTLRYPQVYSGTTCTMCCIHRESSRVWFAHTGDSRMVLGDLAAGGDVKFATEDHKAHDKAEHKRLKEKGAQVILKRYADGDTVSRVFVPRTGVPGLAMSRSLGDGCLKKYGVVAEPEVSEVTELWHACAAPCIVMGSDGLWDVVSLEESVGTLANRRAKSQDVLRGAEALCRRAQRRWIDAEGDYCDDVTVVIAAPLASLSA
eukprot:TRINITY_DN55952_c0_g1_i1.p1 TRINITY_DN55952_c0_g1~~TRINITY_DN55952_c0_g1_i1.p1  ORF type:complete len:514 (-),score=62.65 TRINITY_DN55952_c0_g1_i1:93-1451(-)